MGKTPASLGFAGNLFYLGHFASLICYPPAGRACTKFIGQHGIVGRAAPPELPLAEDVANVEHQERKAEDAEYDEKDIDEVHVESIETGQANELQLLV